MAVSHRTNRLKVIGNPSVEQLQNGRYRMTFNMTPLNPRNDWYNANKSRIFADFGTLESAEMSVDGIPPRTGEAYDDMRLVAVEAGNGSRVEGGDYIVQFVYETLGDTFVQVKDDTIDYELNGLRRVTRESIAEAGTDFQKTVGTTSISSQIDDETAVTCILASYQVDDTDSYRKVTETYIEAGTISEQISNGPSGMPNTVVKTVTSFIVEPASSGITLSKSTNNTNGYEQYEYKFLEKADGTSPVDTSENPVTLVSYEKNIQVRAAGVVSASTVSVTGGTIAVLSVVPPSIKNIKADVTVKLTTDSAVANPVAYNLSDTSCSVATTNTATTPVGVEQGESLTVSVFNSRTNSKTQSFPNHYKTGSNANASYSTAAQIIRDDDNIIGEALNQTVDMDIVLTGSTSAPDTTGVYQEDVDPVFFDANGTQYFRKTRYNIPSP